MVDRLPEIRANIESGVYDDLPDIADQDMHWLLDEIDRLRKIESEFIALVDLP